LPFAAIANPGNPKENTKTPITANNNLQKIRLVMILPLSIQMHSIESKLIANISSITRKLDLSYYR